MKILALTICLLFSSMPLRAADQAMLVFGEKNQEFSAYDLYFTILDHGEWATPMVISDAPFPDILPTIGADTHGDVWVAWIQLHGVSGKLKFRRKIKGNWQPIQNLATGFKTNMAPTLVVDQEGIPWIAWAGVQNQDEDIYFSHWQGNRWTKPTLVHPDNDVPDILPELSLSPEGTPQINWTGFNGRKYIEYTSKWDGSVWKFQRDKTLLSRLDIQKKEQQAAASANLPTFITDLSQVGLLTEGNTGSIRIRK